MTILGFSLTRDGNAWTWADSEAYLDDEPQSEEVMKLAVSPEGLVGASTGYIDMGRRFRGMVEGFASTSFEGAVSVVPSMLRAEHALKQKRMRDVELVYAPTMKYLLVGWSADVACGAVFLEARGFEAVEYDAWSSPYVNTRPQNALEVLEAAQEQMRTLRRDIPTATGRSLTIARVGSLRTVRTSVPLLIGDDEIETRSFQRGGRVSVVRRAG